MPATTAECPELYEKLVAKREWLKTAPPKKKKGEAASPSGSASKKKKPAPFTAPPAPSPVAAPPASPFQMPKES